MDERIRMAKGLCRLGLSMPCLLIQIRPGRIKYLTDVEENSGLAIGGE